jgi:hypothetical protein
MRKFIKNTLLFLLITFFITAAFIFMSNKKIENGDYFRLRKKGTKYIVFGHSHPQYALNDSLIDNLENYAQSSESYFYTFLKIKKIITSNKQIKAVFIEFTNNQVVDGKDNVIWGDQYLSFRYPKYASLMNIKDLLYLFTKNPKIFINSQSLTFKENLLFLIENKVNYINYKNWGSYFFSKNHNTDSLLNLISKNPKLKNNFSEISETKIMFGIFLI